MDDIDGRRNCYASRIGRRENAAVGGFVATSIASLREQIRPPSLGFVR